MYFMSQSYLFERLKSSFLLFMFWNILISQRQSNLIKDRNPRDKIVGLEYESDLF